MVRKEDFFIDWEARRLRGDVRDIFITGDKIEVEYADGRRELYISDDEENYYRPSDEALARLLLRIVEEIRDLRLLP